jgi:hypothetical protein
MTHAIEIVQTNLFIGFPRRLSLFAHCAEVKRKIHPALVYVTAFVPQGGPEFAGSDKAAGRSRGSGPGQSHNRRRTAGCHHAGRASRHALYGRCTEEAAAWAIARQRPQAVAPFVTPVSIPSGALDAINRYYVLCTRDQAIPPALQRRMIAENACADVVELDTDHTPGWLAKGNVSNDQRSGRYESPVRTSFLDLSAAVFRDYHRYGIRP